MRADMVPSQGVADFLLGWEKLMLLPYLDSAGHLTIGVGHLILPGEDFSGGITREFALNLLDSDIRRHADAIKPIIEVMLWQNEYDALCCMTFNIGVSAFSTSTLLKFLNQNQIKAAAAEITKWTKETINGVKKDSLGLFKRRCAEQAMFLCGDYKRRP